MAIEIVAIGDEVLAGITINTNAAYISRALTKLGYSVTRHTVLPDRPPFLEMGLKDALARSSVVIATGGLGPTCDDVTKETAARIFSSLFHTDSMLKQDLLQRFGKNLKSLENQARVPTKAKLLKNNVGTAAGLIFSENGKTLILLPGIPQEMRPMLEEELIPILSQYCKEKSAIASEMIHLGLLTEDAVDPKLRELEKRFPSVEFGIYPGYGLLNIRLSSKDSYSIKACREEIEHQFSNFLFEDSEGKIERAIKTLFVEKKLTLSCAESCTGGKIAEKLTSISGASNYFLGSLVTYSDEIKRVILGVKEETLKAYGAVSKEVAIEMAVGALNNTHADVALAISGIAGPDGGTEKKPVGTVWIAIVTREQLPQAICLHLRGNRETITISATQRALFFLWALLTKGVTLEQWEHLR